MVLEKVSVPLVAEGVCISPHTITPAQVCPPLTLFFVTAFNENWLLLIGKVNNSCPAPNGPVPNRLVSSMCNSDNVAISISSNIMSILDCVAIMSMFSFSTLSSFLSSSDIVAISLVTFSLSLSSSSFKSSVFSSSMYL